MFPDTRKSLWLWWINHGQSLLFIWSRLILHTSSGSPRLISKGSWSKTQTRSQVTSSTDVSSNRSLSWLFPDKRLLWIWKALSSKHKFHSSSRARSKVLLTAFTSALHQGPGCLNITPGKTPSKLSLFFIPSKHWSSNNRATTNLLRNRSFQIWSFYTSKYLKHAHICSKTDIIEIIVTKKKKKNDKNLIIVLFIMLNMHKYLMHIYFK